MNYKVSSSSPTDELLTVGQILSEVGDYASTILDREHLSMARKCMNRLRKVVGELTARQCIVSEDNLYEMPQWEPVCADLHSLTIDELHALYRRWPIRHNRRREAGMESQTFYFEGCIVRELKQRKAVNKAEQFKVDYCVATYQNELDNLAFIFSRPVEVDRDKIYPDRDKSYTPDELTALIHLYADFHDIIEREILVGYVDLALDWLEKNEDTATQLGLLTEVVELRRKEVIHVPAWVERKLEDMIRHTTSSQISKEGDWVPAMLTMHLINKDQALERKAQRLINSCYRLSFACDKNFAKRIECLHTAATCNDYVSRFSIRKVARLWNELNSEILASDISLTARQMFQLLQIAEECEGYADINAELKSRLHQLFDGLAQSDCLEAKALVKIAERRFRYA